MVSWGFILVLLVICVGLLDCCTGCFLCDVPDCCVDAVGCACINACALIVVFSAVFVVCILG